MSPARGLDADLEMTIDLRRETCALGEGAAPTARPRVNGLGAAARGTDGLGGAGPGWAGPTVEADATGTDAAAAATPAPPVPECDPAQVGVRIRPLAWADVTRVAALESELFGISAWTMGMLMEELRGAGRWYIGAQPLDDGGHTPLIGYGGIWFDGEHAHIMTIGVEPAHQGTGVGQCLMATLVARARELGAQSLLLEVAVNNAAAISMYERTGFVRIGLRRRYYQPEDIDAFTMQLILGDGTGTGAPQVPPAIIPRSLFEADAATPPHTPHGLP